MDLDRGESEGGILGHSRIWRYRRYLCLHWELKKWMRKRFQKSNESIPAKRVARASNITDRSIQEQCELTVGFSRVKIIGNLDKIYFDRLVWATATLEMFKK